MFSFAMGGASPGALAMMGKHAPKLVSGVRVLGIAGIVAWGAFEAYNIIKKGHEAAKDHADKDLPGSAVWRGIMIAVTGDMMGGWMNALKNMTGWCAVGLFCFRFGIWDWGKDFRASLVVGGE